LLLLTSLPLFHLLEQVRALLRPPVPAHIAVSPHYSPILLPRANQGRDAESANLPFTKKIAVS
jgi:hypothetical protein